MSAPTLVETKIRVNYVAPGVVPSEMTTGESDGKQKSDLGKETNNSGRETWGNSELAVCI